MQPVCPACLLRLLQTCTTPHTRNEYACFAHSVIVAIAARHVQYRNIWTIRHIIPLALYHDSCHIPIQTDTRRQTWNWSRIFLDASHEDGVIASVGILGSTNDEPNTEAMIHMEPHQLLTAANILRQQMAIAADRKKD